MPLSSNGVVPIETQDTRTNLVPETLPLDPKTMILTNKAIELRMKAYSYAEIGKMLGIPSTQASSLVREALNFIKDHLIENFQELRQLALERLDRWENALEDKAEQGDVPAIRLLLQLEERRSRLCGLNTPQTVILDMYHNARSKEDKEATTKRVNRLLAYKLIDDLEQLSAKGKIKIIDDSILNLDAGDIEKTGDS